MQLLGDVSTRVFYMDDGGISEDATPEQIFCSPKREAAKRFVFRIRSCEYTLTPAEHDISGLLGGLDDFSGRQYCRRIIQSDRAERVNKNHKSCCKNVTALYLYTVTDPQNG